MNRNIKRLIGYIVYVAVFGLLIIIAERLGDYYQQTFMRDFQMPYLWVFLALIGFPILVGAFLALPQFISTVRQPGSWKVDGIKLLVLGLPGVFFALAVFLVLKAPDLMMNFQPLYKLWGYHETLIKLAGLLLGFVLLNAFYKQPEANTIEDE